MGFVSLVQVSSHECYPFEQKQFLIVLGMSSPYSDFDHRSVVLLDTSLLLDTMTLLPVNNSSNSTPRHHTEEAILRPTPRSIFSPRRVMPPPPSAFCTHRYHAARLSSSSNRPSSGLGMSLGRILMQVRGTVGTCLARVVR